MFSALTLAIIAASMLLVVVACVFALRDRLINDWLLGLAIAVEVALLVQVVRGLVGLGELAGVGRKATFAAYLLTLPFVLAVTVFSAIKDKTRWAMTSIAVGAFAVAIMTLRLQQIWDLRG